MGDAVAVRVVVTGRVQGVGFRWSLAQIAEQQGARGWVRNRPDGSVEALIQGTRACVNEMIAWMRHGPPGAFVADAQVEMLTSAEQFEGFEIRS